MKALLDPVIDRILHVVEELFECVPGSVQCKNDNEPHLVKYNTGHRGVCLHTDSADVTLNVALSDPSEFEGGGTYFEAINQVRLLSSGPCVVCHIFCFMNIASPRSRPSRPSA